MPEKHFRASFLISVTTEDGVGSNLGLYDFIDTLKIVLLNVMLQKGYEYVAYQDFSKVNAVNSTILSPYFQTLLSRFGMIFSAGFFPEVSVLFVAKGAKDATEATVKAILNIEKNAPVPWSSTGTEVMHRKMHLLRYRSIYGMRAVRTLFHIGDCASAELWLRQHQFVQVDSLCSQMLVNSMEDIKFAMKILSMRCLLSWQLDWWKPPVFPKYMLDHKKTAEGQSVYAVVRALQPGNLGTHEDQVETTHIRNYTHNTLLRQWFFWKEGLLPEGTKLYDLAEERRIV